MAKKQVKTNTSKFEVSKIGSIMNNIAKTVPIIVEDEVTERNFISTGVYILDAAISGKLLNGGISSNRITAFAGDSGTGKSYIAYSCAKQAQMEGYYVVIIDTEFAINLADLPKYGVDISKDKLNLTHCNKAEEVNFTITQLLDELKEMKKNGEEQKVMIILDSVGQLSSNKEKEDLLNGESKIDMTRAKAINALFRSITVDLGYLNIPMVVCNQTYQTLDMFSQDVMMGGKGLLYAASVICFLSKSKLKSGEEDELDLGQSGINVLCKTMKNRLAKSKKIRFDISFISGMNPYVGLDYFCTAENFDKVGIAKGKMEIDKQTGEMKFIPGGNRWYISHLDKSVTNKNLFNKNVFTDKVMKALEPIINEYFSYASSDEIDNIRKAMDDDFDERSNDKHDDNGFLDNADADTELFGE